MTALTRRRANDPHLETWHVYFGDVRIGTISKCAGVPNHSDQWTWSIGFYPGTEPGMQRGASAATFEDARAAFDSAWQQLEARLTEDNFESWRRDRDFQAWKRRMWDTGCRLPPQNRDGRSTCFCGEPITIDCEAHVHSVHRGIGA
ncbi:hypothetical protein RAD16_10575 [Bradyrhizobium sp. 18BD]